MEIEELIKTIDNSNIESEAKAELVEVIVDGKYARKSEHLIVLQTCKEDMLDECDNLPKTKEKIEGLTDRQMEDIATDISEQLLDAYWDALYMAVEKALEDEDEEKEEATR